MSEFRSAFAMLSIFGAIVFLLAVTLGALGPAPESSVFTAATDAPFVGQRINATLGK
jgi:hypothetical protein